MLEPASDHLRALGELRYGLDPLFEHRGRAKGSDEYLIEWDEEKLSVFTLGAFVGPVFGVWGHLGET